jgi:hypothetical protein
MCAGKISCVEALMNLMIGMSLAKFVLLGAGYPYSVGAGEEHCPITPLSSHPSSGSTLLTKIESPAATSLVSSG